MSSFSFEVDTAPMARSLDSVSGHVDVVTGAVTAMQTAVILQEREAAEQVCRNIDQGFYFLIRSQITQKLAGLRSEVDARLMELKQLSGALAGVRTQMEGDYRMIAQRYSKLFDTLDRTLRSRVYEIDRAAAELSSRRLAGILKRHRDSGAQYLVSGSEALPVSQSAVLSKVRANTSKVITAMKRSLVDAVQLKRDLESAVLAQGIEARRAWYVPVLLLEADAPRAAGVLLTVQAAGPSGTDGVRVREVERRAREAGGDLPWGALSGAERGRIDAALQRVLAGSLLDQRVQNEIQRLHAEATWQAMGGGAA